MPGPLARPGAACALVALLVACAAPSAPDRLVYSSYTPSNDGHLIRLTHNKWEDGAPFWVGPVER